MQQAVCYDIPIQRAMWTLELGEGTIGILSHSGFREAFLEEVMTEESGGTMYSKSIPRHGTTGDGDPAWDPVMTLSLKPQKPAEEEREGGLTFPYNVMSFIYLQFIYLFIHWFNQ